MRRTPLKVGAHGVSTGKPCSAYSISYCLVYRWTRYRPKTNRAMGPLPVWTGRSLSRGRRPNGSQRIRPASMIIMSNIIDTLLLRNLQEVFGEGDPERRRSAIEELYTEDCVVNLAVGQYH